MILIQSLLFRLKPPTLLHEGWSFQHLNFGVYVQIIANVLMFSPDSLLFFLQRGRSHCVVFKVLGPSDRLASSSQVAGTIVVCHHACWSKCSLIISLISFFWNSCYLNVWMLFFIVFLHTVWKIFPNLFLHPSMETYFCCQVNFQ